VVRRGVGGGSVWCCWVGVGCRVMGDGGCLQMGAVGWRIRWPTGFIAV
jgi:hypothetical protein